MRATSVLGGIGLAVPDRSLRSPGRRGTGNAERRRRPDGTTCPVVLTACSRDLAQLPGTDRDGCRWGGAACALVSHGAWSRKARTETALNDS
jgi:hypothetical protein